VAAGETPARAFAATWRTDSGQVVGTTWGGTMCWFPRKPWRLRIERDGFEHVIRCGECPGCLEFERRRLADRLHARYGPGSAQAAAVQTTETAKSASAVGTSGRQLYIVRIWAPLSRHTEISHKLHRRVSLDLEPGTYRLGASSFAVLSREKGRLPLALRAAGVEFRIEPVRFRRRRRAWRALTAGLMVGREVYGEQVKRWYARGLPAANRERWNVLKLKEYKAHDRATGPRAWTRGKLVLVPPEVWTLRRNDRRSVRALLNRAPDPESVHKVMAVVSQVVAARDLQSSVLASGRGKLTAAQVREWYDRRKSSAAEQRSVDSVLPDLHPSSGGEGYVSSEHPQFELMPKVLTDEALMELGPSGRPRWEERQASDEARIARSNEERKQRNRKALAEALESLRKKVTGGK
jgi:hypothetical protein